MAYPIVEGLKGYFTVSCIGKYGDVDRYYLHKFTSG